MIKSNSVLQLNYISILITAGIAMCAIQAIHAAVALLALLRARLRLNSAHSEPTDESRRVGGQCGPAIPLKLHSKV